MWVDLQEKSYCTTIQGHMLSALNTKCRAASTCKTVQGVGMDTRHSCRQSWAECYLTVRSQLQVNHVLSETQCQFQQNNRLQQVQYFPPRRGLPPVTPVAYSFPKL